MGEIASSPQSQQLQPSTTTQTPPVSNFSVPSLSILTWALIMWSLLSAFLLLSVWVHRHANTVFSPLFSFSFFSPSLPSSETRRDEISTAS